MRRPVLPLLIGLALLAVLYVGVRLLSRTLDPTFQAFTTPTLDEARGAGTLLAVYRAEPLVPGAPAIEAAYASRPTRNELGPLLLTRTREASAVNVAVDVRREDPDGPYQMAFDDGAGVRLHPDGTAEAGPFTDGSTSESDLVACCSAFRSREPERFWLVRDGERLVEFQRAADAR